MVIRKGRAGWSMLAMGASLLSITVLNVTGAESIAAAQTPAARGNAPAAAPAGSPPPQEIIPASTKLDPVPDELLHTSEGGLTAEQVGRRAAESSYTAKAADAQIRAAAARVDTAWAAFLPRLTGTARYTRNSSFTPPSLGGPPANWNSVYTTQPVVADPNNAATNGIKAGIDPNQAFAVPNGSIFFPVYLNNYLLQANITVPISDYFLKINQNYTAATKAADALRFDAATARAKSGSDGKVAYYTWMRARGAVIVAVQALNEQRAHLNDARNQFTVGNASRADVLRAETSVAAAELTVVQAKNLASLTEKQMRVAMHAPATENVVPGEAIDGAPPSFQGNIPELTNEALAARLEIKSADANAESARRTAAAFKAGRYPVVSGFGDAVYANPNPRYFSATPQWFPTWDVGVQAIWSPNDVLTANGNLGDYEARAAALEAQKQVTRDGIEIEVTQAYQRVLEADVGLESTKRQLASATEAYRVARELFNNGRGTSTTLTDAETELTRARLDSLNARADAHIARVQLEHALGRDVKLAPTQ